MSEILKQILNWISLFLGSALGGAVFGGIISGFFKGKTEKLISSINVKKIAEDTTSECVEKIKKVSFKQSIQPIVESGLEKVNEKADERLQKTIKELQNKNDKIIAILEKFIAYFDYSIGIPDKVKEEAHIAVREAKEKEPEIEQEIKIEEVQDTKKKEEENIEDQSKINPVR